ncbi:MAG: hypothetical protein K6E84_06220 [Lachnospiraceae bacterium]|nr:hypothetical protein [Lachnospiraceae bacterium]
MVLDDLSEGTHTVRAELDGDEAYVGAVATATFKVVRNESEVTLTGTSPSGEAFGDRNELVFDPENPVIINAVNDKAVSDTYWKWKVSDPEVVSIRKTENEQEVNANSVNCEKLYLDTLKAGEATVKARFSGNKKYNQKTEAITAPTSKNSISYNGLPQELAKPGTVSGNIGIMYYAVTEGTASEAPAFDGSSEASQKNWSTAVPEKTNAGSYKLWYKVVGDDNHKDTNVSAAIPVEIDKTDYTGTRTLSVTVRSDKITTDRMLTLPELPEGARYASEGIVGGAEASLISGTPSVSGGVLTFCATIRPDQTNATITIPVTDATNYYDSDASLGCATMVLTVLPKSVAIPKAAAGLKYTGNEQTGVAAGKGYTVVGGKATAAGNYTATVTLVNTNNYRWSGGTSKEKQIPWSIGKPEKGTTLNVAKAKAKVTKLGNNLFKGAKKLRFILIKSTKLTGRGIGKNAFKGAGKKVILKVPKKKMGAYKKLFRKRGLSKLVKIKKL